MPERETFCYGDILELLHHQSVCRAQMSAHDRTVQVSASVTLPGYADVIAEVEQQTIEAGRTGGGRLLP